MLQFCVSLAWIFPSFTEQRNKSPPRAQILSGRGFFLCILGPLRQARHTIEAAGRALVAVLFRIVLRRCTYRRFEAIY